MIADAHADAHTHTLRRLNGLVGVLTLLLLLAGCAAAPEPVYRHAAVAADHEVASRAGVEILRQGGNAVDAAVATSFCLSVVRPFSCGIGGGGFMVIYIPADQTGGEPVSVALGYREVAPAAVGPMFFAEIDDPLASRFGARAAGVPGTVAGLLLALERYGTLDRAAVLAPAIRAARDGFRADASFVAATEVVGERLADNPDLRDGAAFIWETLCRGGQVRAGDLLRNSAQARALELIAADGADAFYRGPIADAIVEAMAAHGGVITRADLASYSPDVTAPLVGRFGDYRVLAMPPPSSGGIAMLQMFGILERLGVEPGADDLTYGPRYVHLTTEAMKHAFADRAAWLADPAFVAVPVDDLLAREYLDERAAAVSPTGTLDPLAYGSVAAAAEDGGTSHVSIVDANGMAVACTETINMRFGSLVAVPGFGFVLNNEMDDFTTRPGEPNAYGLQQSDRNLPQPGKRPLSSMSPTILLEDGEVVIVAGASGGPRIITGTLQAILNGVLFDQSPRDAVAAPRFHHQWMPDTLQFEDRWEDEALIEAAAALGHDTSRREQVGTVQMILVTPDGVRAASDPRKGGRALGY